MTSGPLEHNRPRSTRDTVGFLLYLLFSIGLTLAAAEYALRTMFPFDVWPVYESDAHAIGVPRKNYAHQTSEG